MDEASFERDGSIEKIGSSSPNIKLNFSTINDQIESKVNIVRAVNWRSIENSNVDVKDYFENKISMRRSIDKKLHYDHIRNQTNNMQQN